MDKRLTAEQILKEVKHLIEDIIYSGATCEIGGVQQRAHHVNQLLESYASQTVVDGDWEKGFEETILDEAEERYDNDNENIVFRHGCNFALNYIKTNLLSKVSVGGMFGLEDVKEALRIGVNIGMSNVQEPRFEGDYNFNQDNALLQCDEYIKSVTPLSSLGSEVQSK